MNSGVYTITNSVNGKVYVGSAVSFTRRWAQHRSGLNKGSRLNAHLQSAWNKYGPASFVFTPILYCDKEFLILWEQIAINGLVTEVGWGKMYNISPTAGSPLGYKHSDKARVKMSESQTLRRIREKRQPNSTGLAG